MLNKGLFPYIKLLANWELTLESDDMLQVGEEIGIVKDNPRLLVIVSHSFVEMMVKILLDHHVGYAAKKSQSTARET